MASFPLFVSILLLLLLFRSTSSESPTEKKAISEFLDMVPHRARISPKDKGSSACNWLGVQCINGDGAVSSLRFPATGLVGSIPSNTIGNLPDLRVLSLRSNGLTGEIPKDFSNLLQLQSLFLQDNTLSGSFPPAFSSLKNLARLDISSNKFNGTLPSSVRNMKGLKFLFLQNNNFSGSIPDLDGLSFANFSNNNFNGSIPVSLSHFPPSVFIGNPALCGLPLPACTQPSTNNNSNKLSTAAIVAICVGSVLLLFILIAAVILFTLRKRKNKNQATPTSTLAVASVETGASSSKDDNKTEGAPTETEKNKLVFLQRGGYTFDLEDLLRASAEVLGKGSFGTSYKALLEEGTSVVVKRLKDVVLTKKDFEAQMELLSHIKHDNIVPLRAYYYSKDEKLLVSDYISHGSLSSLLHGSRSDGRVVLEWIDRLRIAIDVAKALDRIHSTARVVHGNVKSSNILITDENKACVCDYGLNTLFGSSTGNRVGGYTAPEVGETKRVTAKSDVYSFGVVVLELLTGRGAGQGGSAGEEGGDLPRWVQSVVREEWTAEVFDGEMGGGRGLVEEDMVHMLQLGMSCVSHVPDQRPPMAEVVRVLEEMVRG